MNQRSSMLELVRKSCDDAQEMPDFEGVFEPDPEEVTAWQNQNPEKYNGEYRYVNLGPVKVKKMLDAGCDQKERDALLVAEGFWRKAGGYAGASMEAVTVDRGDPREAIHASSMQELGRAVKPVAYVTIVSTLRGGGIPSESPSLTPETYIDRGIIDWNMLQGFNHVPESDDDDSWF